MKAPAPATVPAPGPEAPRRRGRKRRPRDVVTVCSYAIEWTTLCRAEKPMTKPRLRSGRLIS